MIKNYIKNNTKRWVKCLDKISAEENEDYSEFCKEFAIKPGDHITFPCPFYIEGTLLDVCPDFMNDRIYFKIQDDKGYIWCLNIRYIQLQMIKELKK